MMKAITTKWHGATETLPARISARVVDAKPLFMSVGSIPPMPADCEHFTRHGLIRCVEWDHHYAAKALMQKLDWPDQKIVGGWTHRGEYAWILTGELI